MRGADLWHNKRGHKVEFMNSGHIGGHGDGEPAPASAGGPKVNKDAERRV